MTYTSRENSVDDGEPVELHEFRLGATTAWRYASGALEVEYLGNTYTPVAISRGNLAGSDEAARSRLEITAPRDIEVASLFIATSPLEVVSYTLFRDHAGEGAWRTEWKGRITNAALSGEAITFSAESIFTSLLRPGLRRPYQLGCPHVLYKEFCRVDMSA